MTAQPVGTEGDCGKQPSMVYEYAHHLLRNAAPAAFFYLPTGGRAERRRKGAVETGAGRVRGGRFSRDPVEKRVLLPCFVKGGGFAGEMV